MVWLRLAFCLLLACALAAASRPVNGNSGTTDSVRMFATFPHAVAVFTNHNDTSFKCLSATRRNFNPRKKTVTYVLHFKNNTGYERRDVVFDVDFSKTPGEGTFFVNHDKTRPHKAVYHYSDYATCMVITFAYGEKDHCTLWVKRERVLDVPQHCSEKYNEICPFGVPLFDRNTCRDDDD